MTRTAIHRSLLVLAGGAFLSLLAAPAWAWAPPLPGGGSAEAAPTTVVSDGVGTTTVVLISLCVSLAVLLIALAVGYAAMRWTRPKRARADAAMPEPRRATEGTVRVPSSA